MANVFVACPTYDARIYTDAANAIIRKGSRKHRVGDLSYAASLLSYNCNIHWCAALNERKEKGWDWFAMLHSDIWPDDWWIDTLIDIAEAQNADMVSAIVPFKGHDGFTSTAISLPGDVFTCFTRITQAQRNHPEFPSVCDIHQAAEALERLPEPLTVRDIPRDKLLVNTGCCVVRMDRPWCQFDGGLTPRVWFSNDDEIQNENGVLYPRSQGEDFKFSRRIAEEGGKVLATRLVNVRHWGTIAFNSAQTWGQTRDVKC